LNRFSVASIPSFSRYTEKKLAVIGEAATGLTVADPAYASVSTPALALH